MPTYTGEIKPPVITRIDVDSGMVETLTEEIIFKDGVELTRIRNHETIDSTSDDDLDSKLADCPDELAYIKKLKQKKGG